MKYEIKFKQFENEVWNGRFFTHTVEADNQYQALYDFGSRAGYLRTGEKVRHEIVQVHCIDGNPAALIVGEEYKTQGGETVKIVAMSDFDGKHTTYETAIDEDGKHRYSRRDHGRLTGTRPNHPGNIQLGVFWQKYDPTEEYCYILERKY